jgi:hypothetical protein
LGLPNAHHFETTEGASAYLLRHTTHANG